MSTLTTVHPTLAVHEQKIQARHRERLAVVYIRQSTVQQVQRHQESTKLQYSLVQVAQRMGWPRERTLVLDEDLGISGASAEGRSGFQRLLSEVALDHVGVILGVEMSRLARSCKDWHQLLELCALFGTLIFDLDGLYDPSQYNDRLLLGLKGTMSEAELHIIKQRMLQGKLQKARRGELGMPVPIGYVRRPSGGIALDPDEEVRSAVQLIFEQFERLGTMHALLRYLVAHDVRLGVRVRTGADKGELEWRRPNRPTLSNLLHHPIYAGAYVYGRRRIDPKRKKPGRPATGRVVAGPKEWEVCLRDRLPAYISWEQYELNIAQLERNRGRAFAQGAVRHGSALLQGLLVCGRCGVRMATQYSGGKEAFPRYTCLAEAANYGGSVCQGLRACVLDAQVSHLALAALQPAALEVSIQVSQDVERERQRIEGQWRQRLERARYQTERAARQYQAVEPENRLVARSLEAAWEERLRAQKHLDEHYARSCRDLPRILTDQERETIRALAEDITALWDAPTTAVEDRKAILRQIIDKVVVTVEGTSEWVEVVVHWAGDHQTYLRLRRPVAKLMQLSNYKELLDRTCALKAEGLTAQEIAERLNAEGFRPPKRRSTFSKDMVRALLSRQGLTQTPRRQAPLKAPLGAKEWWLPDLARHMDIPVVTMYSWLRRGWIRGRQIDGRQGRWVIFADDVERTRLRALHGRRRSWNDVPPEHALSMVSAEATKPINV